jgi:capsular exopolysaccharide synthesis family protein
MSESSHPSPPLRHPSDTAEQDVHILDRLAIIYRYRRIALTVFVLTTAAVMIQGYSNVRLFQAQARLLIEEERSVAVPGLNDANNAYYEDPEPYFKTQYRILKGRDLTRRVIKALHLETVPEFNGGAKPPATPLTAVRDLKAKVLGLVRPAPQPAAGEPRKLDETSDEAALVDAFIGRVNVAPITDSRLVDVQFTGTDPAFAAKAVNALVDTYVAQNLELKQQGTRDQLDWLQGELSRQQEKVQDSDRALAEYRARENAMSLDDKNNVVQSRLNSLNDQYVKAKATRIEKESLYNQVKQMQASAAPDAIPAVANSPQVQQVKLRIQKLQQDKANLSQRYGEKWPAVQQVNADLADAQQQLHLEATRALESIKNEYETAKLQEQIFSQNLDAAKNEVQDLSSKSISYNVMEREAKSNQAVYDALLQHEKELQIASNSHTNNVRVIDHAEVPKAPITPTGRRTWLLSLAIGLVAAVAVAYGLDYMNDTIKTPEDVARHLKLPFLGLVPSVRGDKHPVLASSHAPHDFSESFRSLRTAILSKYAGDGTKIMVVTSAQPLEGKTTTACNIAMALAYGGARVLLIDADMRRPGLHRPLRLTNERGLSQVLIGQARVRDVIQRTVDPNLLAITAGRTPPNPSELLSSERMKTLLANLAHGPFDWIVIDTPPVLAVTDAVVLAPLVSGVTFVIGAEMTRRRLAERAVETIVASHPKLVAVVLNKVDFARNKYYYSRYYGHQYKNYYAEAV